MRKEGDLRKKKGRRGEKRRIKESEKTGKGICSKETYKEGRIVIEEERRGEKKGERSIGRKEGRKYVL